MRLSSPLRLAAFGVLFFMATGCALAACNLPHFTDKYIGFKVGRPAGWAIDYVNGSIAVKKDASGKTTALVYPIRLKDNQSAEEALNDYVNLLKDVFQKAGDRLGTQSAGASDDRAAVKLSGQYKEATIQGELQASRKGQNLLITGGWSEAWPKNRNTVFAVGECYQKTSGIYLSRTRKTGGGDYMGGATTTFDYALPQGWKVSGITFRGIDLNYDDVTGVSFAYLTNTPGSTNPDQWIDQIAKMAGFSNMRFVASQSLGSVSDPLGMTWEMKAKEYEATFKGVRVHGVMTAAVANSSMYGYGSYSAMMSMRQARVNQWDQFSAITAAVQESIRIADAKAGQGLILPKNNPADTDTVMGSWEYKNQSQDRTSAKWQESIMGYDNVQSPTTGQTYQAPLNSWNDTGPDGPGYYRPLPGGSQEKLEQVNP